MPGKGKILMGKGPVKRPTPVKPKPKAMPVPRGEKKRALPMPKAQEGKERRSTFDTQKAILKGGSRKTKPVMPPKKGGR